WEMVTSLQSSVAVAIPVLSTSVDSMQLTVASSGTVSSGATSSTMVMICSQVEVLPHSSVAVQVRTMVCVHSPSMGPSVYSTTTSPQLSNASAYPSSSGEVES